MSPKLMINFDYNASAPLTPEAKEAMLEIMALQGNPSATHGLGRTMRQKLEEARTTIAKTLKANSGEEIIFTSGGTESNNALIRTFEKIGGIILTSTVEHACILHPSPKGYRIPVDSNGVLDLIALEKVLESHSDNQAPVLVSVILANNETGVLQPLKEIIEIAQKHGALVHTDAAQALGRIPLDLDEYPVDYMTLAGHKVGGPIGCGVLYLKKGSLFEPFFLGGRQELGKRAGTSNTLGAYGFAGALKTPVDWQHTQTLRTQIEKEILAFCPEARVWGQDAPRLPNTISLRMPGVENMTQMVALDMDGFAVSAGSACSSGKVEPSHVLKAMGIEDTQAKETIRISMTPTVSNQDVEKFIDLWKKIYTRAHNSATTNLENKA